MYYELISPLRNILHDVLLLSGSVAWTMLFARIVIHVWYKGATKERK